MDYVSISGGKLLFEASAFSNEDLRDTKLGRQPHYQFISNPENLSKDQIKIKIENERKASEAAQIAIYTKKPDSNASVNYSAASGGIPTWIIIAGIAILILVVL